MLIYKAGLGRQPVDLANKPRTLVLGLVSRERPLGLGPSAPLCLLLVDTELWLRDKADGAKQ